MKKVRIFTPCWGLLFAGRLERALGRSFGWQRNAGALAHNVAGWHIYTRQQDVSRVNDICAPLGFPMVYKPIDTRVREETVLHAAQSVLKQCQEEDCLFMTAFPDIVFGDGSIEVMMELAQRLGSCVIAPHMRVTPQFLDAMTDPMSGPEMVNAAIGFAHPTFVEASSKARASNTFYGGVSWDKIGRDYFVRHSLPSPWISNITPSDVEWFSKEPQWGTYDHNWPGKILDEQRAVIVGSSDAAFMVEVTDQLSNGALLSPVDEADPEKFYRAAPHHKDYRSHVMVFRT